MEPIVRIRVWILAPAAMGSDLVMRAIDLWKEKGPDPRLRSIQKPALLVNLVP